jgi:Na+/melibiose symporter-like transporter
MVRSHAVALGAEASFHVCVHPAWAFCFYALFNPPDGLARSPSSAWLIVFNVVLLQAMTLFHTPHLALGGEMSDDYLERTSIMSYNTFFLWIGDTAGWLMSFAGFFRATAAYPNGALDPSRWKPFSLAIGGVIIVCLSVSSFITRARIRGSPRQPPEHLVSGSGNGCATWAARCATETM